jgi:quinol monooxygenase YgiN
MTADACRVYELRQYTLHPGTREAFIELFETQLLEPQDECGMRVLGQFRDAARPDAFVWLRGFADMQRRRDALTAFYGGPVWAAHRDAANAMMIDSDDVLLLEPAGTGSLDELVDARPPHAAAEIDVVVCPVRAESTGEYLRQHEEAVVPLERQAGGEPLPALQTLDATNTFPRLPVREGEHVAVTLTRYADRAAAQRVRAEPAYHQAVAELAAFATGPQQRLVLVPTARSALR